MVMARMTPRRWQALTGRVRARLLKRPELRTAPVTPNPARSPHLSRRAAFLGAVCALGLGAVGLRAFARRPARDRRVMTPQQAYELAASGAAILIDIRQPEEWRMTGIGKGAIPIDMRRKDFVAAMRAATGDDPAIPIVLICAAGVRSGYLSRQLAEAGFANILDVPEGMTGSGAGPGWIASGLPVTRVPGDTG
jgi:rhodanese-related sulfurtransferase